MRLALAVTALVVLAGVVPGVVAAEPAPVIEQHDSPNHALSGQKNAVSAANDTVSGNVTYLNGSAAANATVMVGSRALFQKNSPSELREIAADNPQDVEIAQTDRNGRYSMTVDSEQVDAEAIVALTSDGISRIQAFSAGEIDLTVRTTKTLAFEMPQTRTEPGGRAPVTFEFVNTDDSAVEGLKLTLGKLPDGWNVAQTSSDSATYHTANRTFVWDSVAPGERVEAEMKLFVAINAETKRYDLPMFANSRTNPVEAGNLTVTVAFPTDRPPQTGAQDGGSGISAPGFGPVVAVVAVLGAALALARRD